MCGVLTSPVVNWRYHGERRDKSYADYNLYSDLTEAEKYLGFPNDSTNMVNSEIASLLNYRVSQKNCNPPVCTYCANFCSENQRNSI